MAGLEGSAGAWSVATGRARLWKVLCLQHAGQFELFPKDAGDSLTQDSDRIALSFRGVSQAVMSRLERIERKPEDLGLELSEGITVVWGCPCISYGSGNLAVSFYPSELRAARSGLGFCLVNLGEGSWVHGASEEPSASPRFIAVPPLRNGRL